MDAQLGRVLDALDRDRFRREHDRRAVGRPRLAPGRPRHVVQTHQLRAGRAHPADRRRPGRGPGRREDRRAGRDGGHLSDAVRTGGPARAARARRRELRRRAERSRGDRPRTPSSTSIRAANCWAAPSARARYRLVEWKKIGEPADTAVLELYDYEADPEETKNLADDKPEVVAQLRAILAQQPEAKPQVRAARTASASKNGRRSRRPPSRSRTAPPCSPNATRTATAN